MSLILTALREALDADRAAAGVAQRTHDLILQLLERQNHMSKQLDDLTAQVAANASVESSAMALIQGMHDKLVEAGTDADKLEALKSDLAASAAQLSAAVTANTPAAAAPVTTDPTAPVTIDPSAPTQVATPTAADAAPADATTPTTTTTVS